MAKENSKMSCVFFNEMHSLRINSNTSDHLSKDVILYSIHPFWFTYICNMNKFIRYVTHSSSSKICCMAKGAKIFTTMDSHFARPHEDFLVQSSYQ
jgi:hypothetical protein